MEDVPRAPYASSITIAKGKPMEPRLIPVDATRRFALVGLDVTVRASARDTAGALSVIEQGVPSGAGTPLHAIREDKLLLLMSGQLVLQLGPREHLLVAGDGATIPGGTPHRFFNNQTAEARLCMLILPGGHEAFLSDLASLEASGALTGPAMRQLSERYGVSILDGAEP